jgi:hypothetical protein
MQNLLYRPNTSSNKRMFVEHEAAADKNAPETGQKCSKTRTIINVQKLTPGDGFLNTLNTG